MYYQNVTLDPGYNYDEQKLTVKMTSTKEYVYPKLERLSTTQFKIWTNDNSIGFDILVGG